MKLSIVTTSYQSSSTICEFIERIQIAVQGLKVDYETIIVDDGSTDGSKELLKSLLPKYKDMVLIELSRNFGHHQAILLGLEHSKGDYVFLIDSDLEEAPELLRDFFEAILSSNSDVIYGVSDRFREGWFQSFLSDLFWKVFRKYTKLKIPKGMCTIRIMKREYVNSLLQHREVNIFLAGLLEITGFIQNPMKIKKIDKQSTSYTFQKKFDLALTSLISFSGRPLRFIAAVGAFVVFTAVIMLVTLIVRNLLTEDSSQGWLSIVTILILLGGIQILSIGMVAVYVASILEEVKNRPRTIVSKIWPEK
jgi:putative glycosyltransferase